MICTRSRHGRFEEATTTAAALPRPALPLLSSTHQGRPVLVHVPHETSLPLFKERLDPLLPSRARIHGATAPKRELTLAPLSEDRECQFFHIRRPFECIHGILQAGIASQACTWPEHPDAPEAIVRLPSTIAIMRISSRALPNRRHQNVTLRPLASILCKSSNLLLMCLEHAVHARRGRANGPHGISDSIHWHMLHTAHFTLYWKSTHFGITTHKRMVPCELSNINWVSPPDFLVPG